jgi:hypothetical protein
MIMVKNGSTHTVTSGKTVKKVLITQPKPDGDKSPYFDLAKKYNLNLDFHPFIVVDGIQAKEFRKQKIDIASFSAVVFTSRNAIDHFFSHLRRNESECIAGNKVFLYYRGCCLIPSKIYFIPQTQGFLQCRWNQ